MMHFTKMQAYGNDYIYINTVSEALPADLAALSRFLCDRHFAVGSDGMVLIGPSKKADFLMRIFNPDGTEGEMCGNALRSVGKYVYDHGLTDRENLSIETLGGIKVLSLTVSDGTAVNIRADIGEPVFDTKKIPVCTDLPEFIAQPVRVLDRQFAVTAVSWGNPHCVCYVPSVDELDVAHFGSALEHLTDLFPNRTNVTFAEYVSGDRIKIREWERGTGETIGCGTGCATAVVSGVRLGWLNRRVCVQQIGGELLIEWDEQSNHLFMTGPSHTVFESEIDISCVQGQKETA